MYCLFNCLLHKNKVNTSNIRSYTRQHSWQSNSFFKIDFYINLSKLGLVFHAAQSSNVYIPKYYMHSLFPTFRLCTPVTIYRSKQCYAYFVRMCLYSM